MNLLKSLMESTCECCDEFAECAIVNNLYLCEKCVNTFTITFEANYRAKEEVEKHFEEMLGNPMEKLEKLTIMEKK